MRTGAWLLIGIGSALVIVTVLVVFIIPSGRRRRPPSPTPRRLTMPRFKIPSGSPAGSLLKGFSYLYAPLRYQRIHYSVGGRLDSCNRTDRCCRSIGCTAAGRPGAAADGRPGQPDRSPDESGEPVVDIFDQPRSEEQ